MVNDQNIVKILPHMGFDHYDYISPNNHSGGLAVLWNNGNIHASILRKDMRAIHVLVHNPEIAKNSIILGIYAQHKPIKKTNFGVI